jgi:hypothetical protein
MDFGQTKDAESKDNIFLRLYQRGEAVGAKGGCWGAEMGSPTLDSNLNDRTY